MRAQSSRTRSAAFTFHPLRCVTSTEVTICGLEIMDSAASVADHPFRGSTALMPGNEGYGMNDAQKAVCDQFVYIPHFGNGTASLNVSVATSIALVSHILCLHGWFAGLSCCKLTSFLDVCSTTLACGPSTGSTHEAQRR